MIGSIVRMRSRIAPSSVPVVLGRSPSPCILRRHDNNHHHRHPTPVGALSTPTRQWLHQVPSDKAGRRAQERAHQKHNVAGSPAVHLDTHLAHAGVVVVDNHDPNDPSVKNNSVVVRPTNTALAPPLHVATTYTRPPDGHYDPDNHSVYGRMDNPTRQLLEQHIATMESSNRECRSFAFCSGMMAVSSIVLAHQAPLHIVLPLDVYHGTPTVLEHVFARFQVHVHRVPLAVPAYYDDNSQNDDYLDEFRTLLRTLLTTTTTESNNNNGDDTPSPSVLVWMETPSNPQCHVIDVATVCRVVREYNQMFQHGAPGSNENDTLPAAQVVSTVVDSTLAPLQQPLQWGCDMVMHSGTKYFGGHSDALVGMVATSNPFFIQRLKRVQVAVGGVASPWDAWLVLRGLRTLRVRYTRQSHTAHQLAVWLHRTYIRDNESSSLLIRVYYPGLPSHPGHAVAKRQALASATTTDDSSRTHDDHNDSLLLFGGVLSLELVSESHAVSLAAALRVVLRATSLGGTETLIEHRSSIEPDPPVSPPGLLRLSVGLEHPEDLQRDFQHAFQIVQELHDEEEADQTK